MNFEDFRDRFFDVALLILLSEALIVLHIMMVYIVYNAFKGCVG